MTETDVKKKDPSVLSRYWQAYGGWSAFIRSGYVWASLGTTVAMFHLWTQESWWNDVIGTLPNVLGFTLGGYAILAGTGDDGFGSMLRRAKGAGGDKVSSYMQASAAFAHFVFVQAIALVTAYVAKATYFKVDLYFPIQVTEVFEHPIVGAVVVCLRWLVWFLGYWLFIYALFLAVAATVAVFRMTRWRQDFEEMTEELEAEEQKAHGH